MRTKYPKIVKQFKSCKIYLMGISEGQKKKVRKRKRRKNNND